MLNAGCLQALAAILQVMLVVVAWDTLEPVAADVVRRQLLRKPGFCGGQQVSVCFMSCRGRDTLLSGGCLFTDRTLSPSAVLHSAALCYKCHYLLLNTLKNVKPR